VVGASALALSPLLACGLSGAVGAVTPTPTPSSGTVTTGRYRVQWQQTAQTAPKVSAAALAALAEGYGKALTTAAATEQQLLQQDLQVLALVSDTYGKSFSAALTKVGVDVARLQADLEAYNKLTDLQERVAAEKTLNAKYLPSYPKAYAVAGMDRDAIVSTLSHQIRPRVTDQKTILPALAGPQLGWGWTGLLDEGLTTPSSCALDQRFSPPYTLSAATSRSEARHADGYLQQYTSAIEVGSAQETASVGVAILVNHAATHVRVEADVALSLYRTDAMALFGYASSEAILRLQLLDGTTVLAEQRMSLARSIAAVFSWDIKDSDFGDHPLRLALDYPRPTGAPTDAELSAVVQVEGWAGAGALGGMATSWVRGTVTGFRVYTAC
jgi:hypothetical protein